MPISEILVHVKSYETWSEHINVAGRVAKDFGARLTGLMTLREVAMLKQIFGRASEAALERQIADLKRAALTEERFRAFLAREGIAGDWTLGEGDASELLSWAGRFHDLVVVEQTNLATDEVGWDVAEQCALASGRPTLVVPHTGEFAAVGRRIVIGWNASREAARAIHGAMPLIEKAEAVSVLLGTPKDTHSSITKYPDMGVVDYLRRHNERVAASRFEATDAEAGAKILEAAAAAGADLIVMGAYGRSWLREWILGGATREVLRAMRVPVLLAN